MSKKINCKWCGMGHAPRDDGNHWIVKSIIPARIDIKECAYHKDGAISPIQKVCQTCKGEGFYYRLPRGMNPFASSIEVTCREMKHIKCDCPAAATLAEDRVTVLEGK